MRPPTNLQGGDSAPLTYGPAALEIDIHGKRRYNESDNETHGSFPNGNAVLRRGFVGLRSCVAGLQTHFAGLQHTVVGLQNDVVRSQHGFAGLSVCIVISHRRFAGLHRDVVTLQSRIVILQRAFAGLQSHVIRLRNHAVSMLRNGVSPMHSKNLLASFYR